MDTHLHVELWTCNCSSTVFTTGTWKLLSFFFIISTEQEAILSELSPFFPPVALALTAFIAMLNPDGEVQITVCGGARLAGLRRCVPAVDVAVGIVKHGGCRENKLDDDPRNIYVFLLLLMMSWETYLKTVRKQHGSFRVSDNDQQEAHLIDLVGFI